MGFKALSYENENFSFPSWLTSLAVFLLVAISLTVPSGYSIGAVLLVLAGIFLLIARRIPRIDKGDGWIITILCVYALVIMAEALLSGVGSRGLDKPLRFLLAIPALFWILTYPPRLAFLWGGIAFGAVSVGAWSFWQKAIEGVWRAQGHTHVIQFGNLSMLIGVLCLAGLGWAAVQRHRGFWVAFLLIGATAGILSSLLSGSRGGWVGFPFVLLVLYRAYGDHFSIRIKLAALTVLVVTGMAIYTLPQSGVQGRVNQAVHNVYQYATGEDRSTSVGARFEMWRGASYLIAQSPFWGWGTPGYRQQMQHLAEEGRIDQQVVQYDHAHNEFIDAFAKRGIIGLVSLLALYLVPMRLFGKSLRARHLPTRAIAVAGVLLPVTYIDFGLTQAFLTHNSGVMMYAFLLVVLWGIHSRQLEARS